jgi:hypothetical protein
MEILNMMYTSMEVILYILEINKTNELNDS